MVLKDFNIEDEAGGAGIPIIKNFTASVTSHTLKINLYWAGRGTTGIPLRGNYGPLISAISVDPSMLFYLLSFASFSLIFVLVMFLDYIQQINVRLSYSY